MPSQAATAVATEGRTLPPVKAIELKIGAIQKQMGAAIPMTMQKYLTPERLTRLFWQEARRNPTLLECSPESVASGIMTAAQLGLEIGVQGQGYLVPYNNKKTRRKEAQFIPGYRGLIALARRSGEVLSIETHIVYEKDTFMLTLGINTECVHKPFLAGDRGAPILVYGVARFREGGHHFEWMPEWEVQAIRRRSQSAEAGPWVTDTDQMRRKTLIRRMSNYLPQSIEFANALTVDEAVNAGNKAVIAGSFVEVEDTAGAGAPEVDKETGEVRTEGAGGPEAPPPPPEGAVGPEPPPMGEKMPPKGPAAPPTQDEVLAMVLTAVKKAGSTKDAEIRKLALADAGDFARSLTGEHRARANAALEAQGVLLT